MDNIPRELAPCGVYCGACPSFNKTCLGCPSESKTNQKRTSKWGCKIRTCCYEEKNIPFCGDCTQFPCDVLTKKLINSHPRDPKFKYRHEIPKNVNTFRKLGVAEYVQYQKQRWSCPSCGGIVTFYHYKCSVCGKEVHV